MRTCPNCGLPDQQGSCDHCGTVFRNHPGAGVSNGAPGQRGGWSEEPSIRHVGQDAQTGQRSPNQQHEGDSPASEGPPQESAPGENPAEEEPASTGEEEKEEEDDGISRRALLGGGAGVAALAVGGGWYFFLRGPTGATGVVAEYVSALSNNDWEQIPPLFHDEAPQMVEYENSGVDTYEAYLRNRGTLTQMEEASPSVNELIEYRHVPDLTAEAAENLFFRIEPENASTIDEVKQILVVAEVEVSTIGQDDSGQDYLAGDTTKVVLDSIVVSAGGGWELWRSPQVR